MDANPNRGAGALGDFVRRRDGLVWPVEGEDEAAVARSQDAALMPVGGGFQPQADEIQRPGVGRPRLFGVTTEAQDIH
jgi:hypothetical protein